MAIVSNTGPILAFARGGHIWVLRQVVTTLIVPDAVWTEVMVKGPDALGVMDVLTASWIFRKTLAEPRSTDRLPQALGTGEREAIVLAAELGATVLLDDRQARNEAARQGLPVIGSIRVLMEAKQRRHIPAIRPVLDALIAGGMFVGEALYHDTLRRAGE